MKASRIIAVVLTVLFQLPITIYIQYYVLTNIHASELIMFLFYVNIPVIFTASIILRIVDDQKPEVNNQMKQLRELIEEFKKIK